MEQIDRRIAQERHHRWPLADVDETGILAEIDVLVAMQPVLDAPVTAA